MGLRVAHAWLTRCFRVDTVPGCAPPPAGGVGRAFITITTCVRGCSIGRCVGEACASVYHAVRVYSVHWYTSTCCWLPVVCVCLVLIGGREAGPGGGVARVLDVCPACASAWVWGACAMRSQCWLALAPVALQVIACNGQGRLHELHVMLAGASVSFCSSCSRQALDTRTPRLRAEAANVALRQEMYSKASVCCHVMCTVTGIP